MNTRIKNCNSLDNIGRGKKGQNHQVVALANRPGFPFLGNDFFREMGDCCLLQMRSQLGVISECWNGENQLGETR